MTSQIFLIIDIEILDILTYISSYFITSELYIRPSNTNTRNNDTIQNNNNNNNNDNSNDDDNNNNVASNYRPITCLPLMGKLLTGVIADQIYAHLD